MHQNQGKKKERKQLRSLYVVTVFLVSLSLILAGGFPDGAANLSLKRREGEVPFQVL